MLTLKKIVHYVVLIVLVLTIFSLLQPLAALAYDYDGYHWNTNLVYYKHTDISDSNWRTAITSAAYTWNAAPANFTMYYGSSSTNTWDDLNWGAYELALTYTNTNGWHITRSYTYMNTYYPWSTTGEEDKIDVETVAVHEFGHWLRLEHVSDPASVMYVPISYGEIHRDLDDDDEDGIVAIYGE